MKLKQKTKPGIALFILMTALVILSLVFRELVSSSSNQATRVRNSADRIEALYLARSSLNLARFILIIDKFQDASLPKGQKAYDRLDDFWALPNYFPLKVEEIKALTQQGAPEGEPPPEQDPAFVQKCQEFFEDFPGETTSITTDLSGKIGLNDLEPTTNLVKVLAELLRPNIEFIRHLNELNVTPESLAREIMDFKDGDSKEADTEGDESYPYSALQLDYGPKNRPYSNMDELKLIPHVDDAVFQYLSNFVNPYSRAGTSKKINLNTASKDVFQSLLINVPDADIVASHFIKDRTENKRTYTEDTAEALLSDAVQIDKEKIRTELLTGASNAFKIETTTHVSKIELKLETIVDRVEGASRTEPDRILIMRVSP